MGRCTILILIEGIDRTGKSTLAERLSAFTGGKVMHFSKPECHPLYEYTASFANFRPAAETVILDRGHVGESVWPLVFGRPTQMDEPVRRWLNMFFMSRGAVLIHAQRNPFDDDIAHEFEAAGEPIFMPADIQFAACLFRDAVADTGLPTWDYRHGNWPGAALHEAARHSMVAGELLDITPRFVGSAAPRLLIVGQWDEGRYLPFMPYEESDGHFLMGELDDWRQCALVSNVRPDKAGPEPLRNLWLALGRPHIVALGGAAADTVKKSELPHDVYGPVRDWRRLPSGSLRESLRKHL
jgi:hypothetical protein